MRVVRYMTRPYNPLSTPHAATANKGTAAITDTGGVQAALDLEKHELSSYMSCHHSLGATGATLNTRNASS